MDTRQHIAILRGLEREIDQARDRSQRRAEAAPPSSMSRAQLLEHAALRTKQRDAIIAARLLIEQLDETAE